MSSDQIIINDITEILNTFTYFIESYENDLKSKLAVEDIKDHFKAAIFVEKVIKTIEEKEIVPNFMHCLKAWLEKSKRIFFYDVLFYRCACDHMLLKYFKGTKYDIEIAIRMYTSACDEERFERVIEKHILESGINEALLNYVLNMDDGKSYELESRLLLLNYKKEISYGKFNEVKTGIETMLNSYQIDKYLPAFIGILVLDNLPEQEQSVKSLVLQILLRKMEDRSYMSKEFWITLIKLTSQNLIREIAKRYIMFLTSLLNFLTYCACLMKCNKDNSVRHWYGDENKSICPEIVFSDILNIVKTLLNVKGDTAEYTISYLNKSKNTNTLFWEDIAKLYL